jgi:hypothetical protein
MNHAPAAASLAGSPPKGHASNILSCRPQESGARHFALEISRHTRRFGHAAHPGDRSRMPAPGAAVAIRAHLRKEWSRAAAELDLRADIPPGFPLRVEPDA